MVKKLFIFLCLVQCSLTYAQNLKTDVIVIGGNAGGVAVAIQCARSKVKTILIDGSDITDSAGIDTKKIITDAGQDIPSGMWGEFRNNVYKFYKNAPGYDPSHNTALKIDLNTAVTVLKNMAHTVKNLSMYTNASFIGIKRNGGRWELSFNQNGKVLLVKARVVVDATENGEVYQKAVKKTTSENKNLEVDNNTKLYRTSIATGTIEPGKPDVNVTGSNSNYLPYPAYSIPVSAVIIKDEANLLVIKNAWPYKSKIPLSFQLSIGQGVGTVAAYCAFFKTNTDDLKVRIIQGELLDFKGYLLPFDDVPEKDTTWRDIQQVCATGMLKGIMNRTGKNEQFLFMPDSLVKTAEIKPVLTEIYTRNFLWFAKEKPGENFTVANTLSLISDYTLTDPGVLIAIMQKAWKTQYKFNAAFNLNRAITRREFAVLINKFLNPFARTVDLGGNFVN